MPDGREDVSVKVLNRINKVSADEWDSCAGGANPFVRHAFLNALEESGSVRARLAPLTKLLPERAGT